MTCLVTKQQASDYKAGPSYQTEESWTTKYMDQNIKHDHNPACQRQTVSQSQVFCLSYLAIIQNKIAITSSAVVEKANSYISATFMSEPRDEKV